jgi:hypothetical protein
LQDTPKFTQIGDFWNENIPSGNPDQTVPSADGPLPIYLLMHLLPDRIRTIDCISSFDGLLADCYQLMSSLAASPSIHFMKKSYIQTWAT